MNRLLWVFWLTLIGIQASATTVAVQPEVEGLYRVRFDCSDCVAPYLSEYLNAELNMVLVQPQNGAPLIRFSETKYGIEVFTVKVVERSPSSDSFVVSSRGVGKRPMEGRLFIDLESGRVDGRLMTAANEVQVTGEPVLRLQSLYSSAPVAKVPASEMGGVYKGLGDNRSVELFVRQFMAGGDPYFAATAWLGGLVAVHFPDGQYDAERAILTVYDDDIKWVLGYRFDSEGNPAWRGFGFVPSTGRVRVLELHKRD